MLRRTLLSALLMVASLFTLGACGDSTGPGGGSITGTYKLQTVNGNPLPYVIVQVGSDKVEVSEGSLTLNADNTYSSRFTFRTTEGGQVTTETDTSVGTYTRNNNAITFTDSSDGETITGSVSGNTITFTEEGLVLVFKK